MANGELRPTSGRFIDNISQRATAKAKGGLAEASQVRTGGLDHATQNVELQIHIPHSSVHGHRQVQTHVIDMIIARRG